MSDPTEPSRPVQKILFAMSGNRCAFPGCTERMVEAESGRVLGDICHIEGAKEGSPRWRRDQPAAERHGFYNLMVMCTNHHRVTDDVALYPVERLHQMKRAHETAMSTRELDPARIVLGGDGNTVAVSQGQSGGVTAGAINVHLPHAVGLGAVVGNDALQVLYRTANPKRPEAGRQGDILIVSTGEGKVFIIAGEAIPLRSHEQRARMESAIKALGAAGLANQEGYSGGGWQLTGEGYQRAREFPEMPGGKVWWEDGP